MDGNEALIGPLARTKGGEDIRANERPAAQMFDNQGCQVGDACKWNIMRIMLWASASVEDVASSIADEVYRRFWAMRPKLASN